MTLNNEYNVLYTVYVPSTWYPLFMVTTFSIEIIKSGKLEPLTVFAMSVFINAQPISISDQSVGLK